MRVFTNRRHPIFSVVQGNKEAESIFATGAPHSSKSRSKSIFPRLRVSRRFRLLDHFGIEFARVSPPDPKNDKRLNKDNVALVISLEQIIVNSRPSMSKTGIPQNKATDSSMKSGEIITPTTTTRLPHSYSLLVVANTHILANPEAPDVKIWQANTLTS